MAPTSPTLSKLSLKVKLGVTAVTVAALAAFIAAVVVPEGNEPDISITGNEAIEDLIPSRGAESVAAQTEVAIELAPGWAGELVAVDGIAIPNDVDNPDATAVDEDGVLSPLGRWSYRPDEGKIIERLDGPLTCVEAAYWPIENPDDRSAIQWCFNVI